MPTVNRSAFSTGEVALQWVKILVPIATVVGAFLGFIISLAVWKAGVDSKLQNLLDLEEKQGQKMDWLLEHYGPMPANLHPRSRVVFPLAEAETQQDSSATGTHY